MYIHNEHGRTVFHFTLGVYLLKYVEKCLQAKRVGISHLVSTLNFTQLHRVKR